MVEHCLAFAALWVLSPPQNNKPTKQRMESLAESSPLPLRGRAKSFLFFFLIFLYTFLLWLGGEQGQLLGRWE
jgi:hypothetical protein